MCRLSEYVGPAYRLLAAAGIAAFGLVVTALPAAGQSLEANAAAGQTAAAPPSRPPFPNRLNNALPSWLRVRGEFRERVEGFDGLGFDGGRQDLYYLSRFRFNAAVTASKHLSFQAQVQDARVAKKAVGPTGAPFRAPFDLRAGFADIGSPQGRLSVRVGRQELFYGDQRLVGHVSWLNAARTFDGAKVSLRGNGWQAETFATSVVRILPDEFDRSGAGNRFAGSYVTLSSLLPTSSVEPYVFYRRDVNQASELADRGTLNAVTAGVRWIGRLPAGFEYNTDTVVQRGSLVSDDVRAWAGHYQLRTPPFGGATLRASSEFNYASGDRNPNDGIRGTFDQLYPTPHDKYGLADQVGWRNIRHLRAGIEMTPVRNLPLVANYHTWWLNEARDGLYNAGGALLAVNAAGATNLHVGHEVDVLVSRALSPQLQLSVGYAHIFAGPFLKQTTPGASYSHPYVMATYVFLAER